MYQPEKLKARRKELKMTQKDIADQLGITGTVKNEDDGSVTIEAAGDDEAIKKFVEEVKRSPSPSGRVQYVDLQENPMMEDRKKFVVIG